MTTDAIAPAVDITSVYEDHVGLLIGTAVSRYHIAPDDAQALVHDVFVAYLLKAHEINDSRAWLLSSICNASKFFVRTRARHVALPPEHVDEPDPQLKRIVDALPDQIAARDAFGCLTARCQLALRLRYLEGYSVPEIATALQTTPKYAAKLVARCLRQAHDRYTGGTR
jgi:RNA polymerase sigma factor (sigma-70 family)